MAKNEGGNVMNRFIKLSFLSLTAIALLLVVNTARAESESATKVQSATISGSEIKSGDEKTCVDGAEMVQKSLVFTTTVDGKDSNEITTRSWFEATGESCEGENAYEIPAPSDELKTMLAKESKERPNAAAGQLGRPYCSNACVYTWGRYECWYGAYYWMDYCYNECSQYTGQYYYTYYGRC